MFRSKNPRVLGMTLIEILIASVLAFVVFAAVLSVFLNSQKVGRTAGESFFLTQDVSVALETIVSDLKHTTLGSIKVDSDGFALPSPYTQDEGTRKLDVTEFGGVRWKSWVHYSLQPGKDFRETLVREESPIGDNIYPHRPPTLPNKNGKPLLSNILGRGKIVKETRTGEFQVVSQADTPPGFTLRFVGRDGTRTTENPAAHSDEDKPGWTQNTTPMIELTLQVVNIPSDFKVATLRIVRQITPRN